MLFLMKMVSFYHFLQQFFCTSVTFLLVSNTNAILYLVFMFNAIFIFIKVKICLLSYFVYFVNNTLNCFI